MKQMSRSCQHAFATGWPEMAVLPFEWGSSPASHYRYLRPSAQLIKALSEETFVVARAAGKAMAMEQAIAYALEGVADSSL
jgi:hypothetical protein